MTLPADGSAPPPAADPLKPNAFPPCLTPRRDEDGGAAPPLDRHLALANATYLPQVAPPVSLNPSGTGAAAPTAPPRVDPSQVVVPLVNPAPLAPLGRLSHTDIDRWLLELDAPIQGLSPQLAAACRSVKPGAGEDARPIAWTHPDGDGWFLAVCDGMGGSGSLRHTIGNHTYTGAAIGATVVARNVENWLQQHPGDAWRCVCTGDHETLAYRIREHLAQVHREFGSPTSRVKFKLFRPFPTTFSAVAVHRANGRWVADCYWAGDSRIYHCGVRRGLRQLSRDDLDTDLDPYVNLVQDGPLCNLCSGDQQPKTLNHRRYTDIDQDDIIFVASDGVFHYQVSPMHFEAILYSRILKDSQNGWQPTLEGLLDILPNQDDRSIALLDLDESLKQKRDAWFATPQFADRVKTLGRIMQMQRGPELEAEWKQYRITYCAYEHTEAS